MLPLFAEHGPITLDAYLVLMILGALMLGLATIGVPSKSWWNWFPGGVFLIVLAQFFHLTS